MHRVVRMPWVTDLVENAGPFQPVPCQHKQVSSTVSGISKEMNLVSEKRPRKIGFAGNFGSSGTQTVVKSAHHRKREGRKSLLCIRGTPK